jgi:hypothetical protein
LTLIKSFCRGIESGGQLVSESVSQSGGGEELIKTVIGHLSLVIGEWGGGEKVRRLKRRSKASIPFLYTNFTELQNIQNFASIPTASVQLKKPSVGPKGLIGPPLAMPWDPWPPGARVKSRWHKFLCLDFRWFPILLIVRFLFPGRKLKDTLKGWFNKEFVFTGKIEKEFYKIYNRAFDKRQEGDYDDFVTFAKEEVIDDLENMKKFLKELESFIDKQLL